MFVQHTRAQVVDCEPELSLVNLINSNSSIGLDADPVDDLMGLKQQSTEMQYTDNGRQKGKEWKLSK
jgi:hypothetical protein